MFLFLCSSITKVREQIVTFMICSGLLEYQHNVDTRVHVRNDLTVPVTRSCMGQRAFSLCDVRTWNQPPTVVRDSNIVDSFTWKYWSLCS